MSRNLVDLSIRGTFTLTPDFFHERSGGVHELPSWPRLQRLSVMTTNITPAGGLYVPKANSTFLGDGYEREVWINDVLARPNKDVNDLLLSLSSGMLRMPKLEELEIRLLADPSGEFVAPWHGLPERGPRIHNLIHYNRKASQSVPLANCSRSPTATGTGLSCNLGIFNEEHIKHWEVGLPGDVPKPLLWAYTPGVGSEVQERTLKNWNELHFRIKGNALLPEWRMEPGDIAEEIEAEIEEYPWYPVIRLATAESAALSMSSSDSE